MKRFKVYTYASLFETKSRQVEAFPDPLPPSSRFNGEVFVQVYCIPAPSARYARNIARGLRVAQNLHSLYEAAFAAQLVIR